MPPACPDHVLRTGVSDGGATAGKGLDEAVEVAVREQFSGKFSQFGALRRQRNDIEYPRIITAPLTKTDADSAIGLARELTEAAQQLLTHLGLFA